MTDEYNLESIARKYDVVLLDTSAAFKHSVDNIRSTPHLVPREDLISAYKKDIDYLKGLTKDISERQNIRTTEKVLKEIIPHKNKKRYKAALKNKIYRETAAPPQIVKSFHSKKRRLVRILTEEDRTIKLNDIEKSSYDSHSRAYESLKKGYRLSDTDYDLIIKGLAFVLNKKKCALLSNDNGIRRTWKHIRIKNNISFDRFGFYLNFGTEKFLDPALYLKEVESKGLNRKRAKIRS